MPEQYRCYCGATGDYDAMHDDDGLVYGCDGTGQVECRCGGDTCVCHHHGTAPCPGCDDCEPDEDTDTYDDGWGDEEQDPHDRGSCDGHGMCRWCDAPPEGWEVLRES